MLCLKPERHSDYRSHISITNAEKLKSLGYDVGSIVYTISEGSDGLDYIYNYHFISNISGNDMLFFSRACGLPLFMPSSTYQRASRMSEHIPLGMPIIKTQENDRFFIVNPSSLYKEHKSNSYTVRAPLGDSLKPVVKTKTSGGASFHILGVDYRDNSSIKTEFGNFSIDRSELSSKDLVNIITVFPEAAFHRKTDYSISSF